MWTCRDEKKTVILNERAPVCGLEYDWPVYQEAVTYKAYRND